MVLAFVCLTTLGVVSFFDINIAHAGKPFSRLRSQALGSLCDHVFAAERGAVLEMERIGWQSMPSQLADMAAQQYAQESAALRELVRLRQRRQKDLWSDAFGEESLFAPGMHAKFEIASQTPTAASDLHVAAYTIPAAGIVGIVDALALGGLRNLGLTCFLKAVVQLLLRLPRVRLFLD